MVMGDGNSKLPEGIITVDAPVLGAKVELHEGTVGDALRLIEAQQSGLVGFSFMLEALAISLRVDGKRLTVEQLKALPMKSTNTLMRIGTQALELNRFFSREDGEESGGQEPTDPKG